MARPVNFELSADEPERAARFWSEAFGWRIEKWQGPEDYWLITTGAPSEPGIDGALMRREQRPEWSGPATVNTLAVPSVDEALCRVVAAGGHVVADKMAVPGVGYYAYCQDTEGNTFGVKEANPELREEQP